MKGWKKRMQSKNKKKNRGLQLFFLFLLLWMLCQGVAMASDTTKAVCYTALGDSIPNGYCADSESEIVSYPTLIAKGIQEESLKPVELDAYAKNGLTTVKLNQTILSEEETRQSIQKADVITITIGANDLMNQFKKECQEILENDTKFRTTDEALEALQAGITENPLLLVKVVSAISGWDYASFEGEWNSMMETIAALKKSEAQIVVTTLYNPVSKHEMPGTMNRVVEDIIEKMNQIMYDYGEVYKYKVVDLVELNIEEYTQSDGLHPNQEGQKKIGTGIKEALDIQLAAGLLKDIEMEEKKAKQKEMEKEENERQQKVAVAIVAGNAAAIWLVIFLYRKKRNEKSDIEQETKIRYNRKRDI